jgi:polar amino acid transport system substrate-binding protein
MTRRLSAALAIGAVAGTLSLSACGSDTLSSGGSTSSNTSTSVASGQVDPALAAKVPDKIKSAGVIKVGSDASYAPNEFLADDGKTVQGMDVDIFNAVAAKFGLKTDFQNAGFPTLILGVTSGKYDLSISSFTINDERKQQVNMVSYFSAGTQWAVKTGNPKKVSIDNACGFNIGVQKGTVQIDDLTARSKKCTDAGKPAIKQVIEEQQSKVTTDLVSGKVDAMLADSPVCLYAVKQTSGQLEPLGDIYESAPYGIVIPKDQTDFAQAIADALKAIKASGAYDAALKNWGNESGGISDFAVNP